jgi:hypothetical protein
MSAPTFIACILAAKDPKSSLSSALRLYIAQYFRNTIPRYALVDPDTKWTLRLGRPRAPRSKRAAASA